MVAAHHRIVVLAIYRRAPRLRLSYPAERDGQGKVQRTTPGARHVHAQWPWRDAVMAAPGQPAPSSKGEAGPWLM